MLAYDGNDRLIDLFSLVLTFEIMEQRIGHRGVALIRVKALSIARPFQRVGIFRLFQCHKQRVWERRGKQIRQVVVVGIASPFSREGF